MNQTHVVSNQQPYSIRSCRGPVMLLETVDMKHRDDENNNDDGAWRP